MFFIRSSKIAGLLIEIDFNSLRNEARLKLKINYSTFRKNNFFVPQVKYI
jgi:hypothetical protein